jgi:pyruvate dehydrogenase E1 component
MRTRGFLLGGTSGRTTLSGEGLQHEDGHSHLLAYPVPNLRTYDPAYAYELAVIIQDGLKRMYSDQEDIFYYITLMNENYAMPPMPKGAEEGIRRGIYQLLPAGDGPERPSVQLLGSGTILREVLEARKLLGERFGVSAEVFSVTSWKELYRDALACERHSRLHPEAKSRQPYITSVLREEFGPAIAATDYMKALPDSVGRFVPGGIHSLGTDGFGRSDTRAGLRRHFEVDGPSIAIAALHVLARQGKINKSRVKKALQELDYDADKADPWLA